MSASFPMLASSFFSCESFLLMSPEISIIVPVYNAEKTLRRCVDSILAQQFFDFELILVDDGFSDGSAAICDAYGQAVESLLVGRHLFDNYIKVYRSFLAAPCTPRNIRKPLLDKIVFMSGRFPWLMSLIIRLIHRCKG